MMMKLVENFKRLYAPQITFNLKDSKKATTTTDYNNFKNNFFWE